MRSGFDPTHVGVNVYTCGQCCTITGLRLKQNNTMQMLQPKNPSKNRLDLHLANWTDCIITDMPFGQYDYSPIRTVIVSQGDESDFHHIQGVVGDLIAVRIQDVCVFLSPPP